MLSFYSKLSPSQKLLVAAVGSMLGAAVVTTGTATWQIYSQQGQLNIGVLFGAALSTFCVLMSKSLADYVPAHVQLELQAVQDSNSQLHDALARAQAISQSAINKNVVQAAQAPIVHVYTPQQVPQGTMPADLSTIVSIPAQPTDVSAQATQSVPAVNIAVVDVPQVPFPEPPSVQPPAPDYSGFHWGDTQAVPLVVTP
jgi:hypothetical protein